MSKKLNKWKVISTQMVLDEPWYKVQKERVEIKPGQEVDYYVSLWGEIAIIVAVTPDKKIILIKEYKHGAQEILTLLPAGYFDINNEDALEAAKRELSEETGYTAQKWQKIGTFYQNSSKERGNNIHVFLAQDAVETDKQNFDETENIEVISAPIQQVKSMIEEGEIKNSGSVLALLTAFKKLGL